MSINSIKNFKNYWLTICESVLLYKKQRGGFNYAKYSSKNCNVSKYDYKSHWWFNKWQIIKEDLEWKYMKL